MADVLGVLMRWLHISSVATLIGGILYARLVSIPSAEALSADVRELLDHRAASLYRPLVYSATAALIVSGVFNILSTPGHSTRYHILLGIKLLLVLHVLSVGFLVVKPENPRRARMMTGMMISGLVIIAISAYLRRIF